MPVKIRFALALSAAATALALWCLVDTTALSMTMFFSLGLPLFGLGVFLYLWEVVNDLRQHEVL